MKKAALALVVLILAGGMYFASTLPGAMQAYIQDHLRRIGFPSAQIIGTHVKKDGYTIDKIILDADGFNTLEGVSFHFNWFQNIFQKHIDSVEIKNFIQNDLAEDINLFMLLRWLRFDTLQDIPLDKFHLEKGQYNVATDFGDIRIEGKTLINTNDADDKTIQAVLWARQYQLGFELPLTGAVRKDGSYLYESLFHDGNVKVGPFRVSRMNGWASFEGTENKPGRAALQLNAGSGEIFAIPLQDISLTVSKQDMNMQAVGRSGLTGMKDTSLFFDLLITSESQKAGILLEVNNKDDLKTLMTIMGHENLFSTLKLPLLLRLDYQPERRFAGGPLPFSLMLVSNDKDTPLLSGNILLYPDTFIIRGSLLGDPKIIDDVNTLIQTPDTQQLEGSVILDVDGKKILNDYLTAQQN